MSKLNDLIKELCPDGVEYKPLDELCEIITKQTGFDYSATIKPSLVTEKREDTYSFIQNKNFDGLNICLDTDFFIPIDVANRFPRIVLDKPSILISLSGKVGNVGLYELNEKAFIGGAVGICKLKEGVNGRYVMYYLESKQGQKYLLRSVKAGSHLNITVEAIRKAPIPLPPLEIQREIVRVLDSFNLYTTELTTKLTAEHIARRKQYNFYLNKFFENQKENIVELASLGSLTRGKRFVHKDAVDIGVPCIHYGELYTYYGVYADRVKSYIREELRDKMRYAKKGDVIIVGAGENNIDIGIGVAWEGDEDVAVHDACYTLKHNQNPKYISYFLRSEMYHSQIKKYVSSGKICAISSDGIGRALIPIPSIEKQNAIVAILDKFESLISDISNEIPAEIDARNKQYRFYKDMVMNFKKEET